MHDDQPLGLTIHSLPRPEDAEAQVEQQTRRTRRGRLQMLLVLLACAAPIMASYFTYYVVRPEGRRNFGELVQPQRPLPAMPTVALDGTPGSLALLNLMMMIGPGIAPSIGSGLDALPRPFLVRPHS